MGIIKKILKWLDKGIVKLIGEPEQAPPLPKIVYPKPLISARKALLEERHELFEEDMNMWERRKLNAMRKHREEGMSEEELENRYVKGRDE